MEKARDPDGCHVPFNVLCDIVEWGRRFRWRTDFASGASYFVLPWDEGWYG